jgi:hypothetical protein
MVDEKRGAIEIMILMALYQLMTIELVETIHERDG